MTHQAILLQARADAALKAREAAEIAEEAADRRRAAETEVMREGLPMR